MRTKLGEMKQKHHDYNYIYIIMLCYGFAYVCHVSRCEGALKPAVELHFFTEAEGFPHCVALGPLKK